MAGVADVREPTKGERTRQAVIDAAIARFGRDGFRATSVADITRDASVGGTVAYAYFPSKEALFLAAVDEDVAGVIREGASSFIEEADLTAWPEALIFRLLESLERHPLAKRLLAGLEPDVTVRVLETPALADLRRVCAQRLRTEQLNGTVRPEVDPVRIANGLVSIILSLLMSVVQLGGDAARTYGADVAAVLEAAVSVKPR